MWDTWKLCASFILYVMDVISIEMLSLRCTRKDTMPKVQMQTKIEQRSNCRAFPIERSRSFRLVLKDESLWWIGHVPQKGYNLRRGMMPV